MAFHNLGHLLFVTKLLNFQIVGDFPTGGYCWPFRAHADCVSPSKEKEGWGACGLSFTFARRMFGTHADCVSHSTGDERCSGIKHSSLSSHGYQGARGECGCVPSFSLSQTSRTTRQRQCFPSFIFLGDIPGCMATWVCVQLSIVADIEGHVAEIVRPQFYFLRHPRVHGNMGVRPALNCHRHRRPCGT